MKSEWFKDWFNTPEYLNVYKNRNEEEAELHIAFILNNISLNPGSQILDMACGTGRHSIVLARKNFDVTSVDLSENLISVAKKTAEFENLNIKFIQSDIRNFISKKNFDLVLNLFTSFGYFDTDEENFSVLQKAFNFLKPKGYFVLDYLNTEYLKNNLIELSKDKIENGEIIQKRIMENNRIVKKISILKNGDLSEYEESVKMYSEKELIEQLKLIGFDIYKTFGDFLGNKFNTLNSPRLIIICRK
jgi:cyclopropane fatty-acyl-phospholipid synthase-like methyltransferase